MEESLSSNTANMDIFFKFLGMQVSMGTLYCEFSCQNLVLRSNLEIYYPPKVEMDVDG